MQQQQTQPQKGTYVLRSSDVRKGKRRRRLWLWIWSPQFGKHEVGLGSGISIAQQLVSYSRDCCSLHLRVCHTARRHQQSKAQDKRA